MNTNDMTSNAQQGIVKKRKGLPLVWLLPVIAFIVSGWLIVKTILEKGPEITITFPTADGLEVDKTKIKYRDVEIGKVTTITITDDLQAITVTAELNPNTADYLKENTRFWVVRPQIGLGGVSGLGTLLSGPYIEVQPGDGAGQKHFTGLTRPPVLKEDNQGQHYVLEVKSLDGISPGTPIHFHGVVVGEVLGHQLSDDGSTIHLPVFINAPYDKFIHSGTRFWKDSGIDFTASANGFKLKTGPLVSMLSGGIAFSTPDKELDTDVSPKNTAFHLYDDYDQTRQVVYRNTLKYVMFFQGEVRGLSKGAPVQLRGIPIGKVNSVSLEIDEKTTDIQIPVVVELEPERVKQVNGHFEISDEKVVELLVEKGLRAQLQTGSLLTGELLVELDFHPDKPIRLTGNANRYPEFPTIPGSLDQFSDSAKAIMNKVAKLPLDDMIKEVDKTLVSVQGTLKTTDATMVAAQQALSTLEPGSTTRYQLEQMLQEVSQAAGSVRELADYLEQNPGALLSGKQ